MADELKNKKIVCLGGGIGTTNLIRGLKSYSDKVSAIVPWQMTAVQVDDYAGFTIFYPLEILLPVWLL